MARPAVVHVDPEIMSGTPVFVGTRVPFRTFIDYLVGGQTLAEFLDDFPTVRREQAVAALEEATQRPIHLQGAVEGAAMKGSALLEAASRLEVSERIELVEAIWETLSVDAQSLPVAPAHQDDLDRRLVDLETSPDAGSSWGEVRERLGRRRR